MRSRVLVVVSALTLALLLPGAVGARNAQSATQAADARLLAYWTPARIANAKPRDYIRDASGKFVPSVGKPGGGGGGGNVTGASWTLNGAIETRAGRILFSSGGSDWICSGSVINDGSTSNSSSIVLTAGHCVYDGPDGWSYNFMFMPDFDDNPDYNCATRSEGCWRANRLAAHSTFVSGGGFGTNATVRVDYGFAQSASEIGGNAELDANGNSYTLKSDATPPFTDTQYAFGYPAEGRYKGKDLIYCKGPVVADPYGADTWGIGCNMNGGSSGGPWLWDSTNWSSSKTPADGSGQQSSVNSYGYSGLTYMFGPKFNSETTSVLNAAKNGSSSGSGVVVTPIS